VNAPAFHPQSRKENLARLIGEPLDVLIIGGGINGAGIARDLALRACGTLRIGLIEKRYFGSGTSSRNSQLIHGGLRYLEHFDFALVKEALHERARLVKLAPGLVEPLRFVMPFETWFQRRYYGIGLWLYDLLAGSHNIAPRLNLSLAELKRIEPDLNLVGLHSAAIFSDCRVNSARLLLENLFDAARHGVIAVNYAEAAGWQRRGEILEVNIEDRLGGGESVVRAHQIVDARGPWEGGANLRLVRGSHIIVPALTDSGNAIAHFHRDGRIIFVIPWGPQNSLSLIGTTDVDHSGSPDEVSITPQEIRYLQAIARELFRDAGDLKPIAVYSSLRPLVAADGSPSAASRGHKIWKQDGVVKITGGKYTTYRSMSQEAVDLLAPDLRGRCTTHESAFTPARKPDTAEAIIQQAVDYEMAQRLADLMFVCTYWGYERSWDAEALRPLAHEMGRPLAWSDAQREQQIALVLRIAAIPAY